MRRAALLLPLLLATPALACPPAPGQFAPNCVNNGNSVDGFSLFFLQDLSNPVPPGGAGQAGIPIFLVTLPPVPPDSGLALGNFSNLWNPPPVNSTSGPPAYQIAPGRPPGEVRVGDPVRDNRTGEIIGTVVNSSMNVGGPPLAPGTVLPVAGQGGGAGFAVRTPDGRDIVVFHFAVGTETGPAAPTGPAVLPLSVTPPGLAAVAMPPAGPLGGGFGLPPLLPTVSQPTVTGTFTEAPRPTLPGRSGFVVQYPDGRRLIVDGAGNRIGSVSGGLATFDQLLLVGQAPFNLDGGNGPRGRALTSFFFWVDDNGVAVRGNERRPPPGTIIYEGATITDPSALGRQRLGTVSATDSGIGTEAAVDFDPRFVDAQRARTASSTATPPQAPPRPPQGFRVPATADDRAPPPVITAAPPPAPPVTVVRANGSTVTIAPPTPTTTLPGTPVGEGTLLVTAGGSNTQVPVTIVRRPDGALVAVDAQGVVRGTAEERKAGPFGLTYKVTPLPSQPPVAPPPAPRPATAATAPPPAAATAIPTGGPSYTRLKTRGQEARVPVPAGADIARNFSADQAPLQTRPAPSSDSAVAPTQDRDDAVVAQRVLDEMAASVSRRLADAVERGEVPGRVEAGPRGTRTVVIPPEGLDAARPYLDAQDQIAVEMERQYAERERAYSQTPAGTPPAPPPAQAADRAHAERVLEDALGDITPVIVRN